MNTRGQSMIELLVAVALLSALLGIIFGIGQQTHKLVTVQEARRQASIECGQALEQLTRELRQAADIRIERSPEPRITYQIPVDRDGDGLAIDAAGRIELGEPRTIRIDHEDTNEDGFSAGQLVLEHGGRTRVIANRLATDGSSAFDVEERDGGLWLDLRVAYPWTPNQRLTIHRRVFVKPRNK